MAFNLFRRKPKPKPEIKRLEVSEYGEPKYEFKHVPTLEVYREYNDTVSAPAIARDKQLKRAFGLIMGVITIIFAVLSVLNFDYFDPKYAGRGIFVWMSYTGFMFYFIVFLMSAFALCPVSALVTRKNVSALMLVIKRGGENVSADCALLCGILCRLRS